MLYFALGAYVYLVVKPAFLSGRMLFKLMSTIPIFILFIFQYQKWNEWDIKIIIMPLVLTGFLFALFEIASLYEKRKKKD